MSDFYDFNFDELYLNKYQHIIDNYITDNVFIEKYVTKTKENALLYHSLLEEYKTLINNHTIVIDDNISLYTYNEIDTNRKNVVYNNLINLILEQRKLSVRMEHYTNKNVPSNLNKLLNTITINNTNTSNTTNTMVLDLRTKFNTKNTSTDTNEKEVNVTKITQSENKKISSSVPSSVSSNSSNKINLRDKFKKKDYFENDNTNGNYNFNDEISLLNDSSSSISELRQKYRIRKYGLKANDSSSMSSVNTKKSIKSNNSNNSSKSSKKYTVNRQTESIQETQSLNNIKPKFKMFNPSIEESKN